MGGKKVLPIMAIVATSIIWGLSFLSIKVTVGVLPPMTLALVRFLMGSVVLSIIYMIMEKEKRLNRKDIPLLALSGFIGVSAYFYFENNGIQYISASSASIIIAAIPIFALIAEIIFLKAELTKKKVISVVVSFFGVYLIVGFNSAGISENSLRGYLFMLGAVLVWVAYSIITKPLYKKYSQITIVYFQTLFGTLFLIPFVFFETTNWSLIDSTIILNVVYLGIFCSAMAYYLYIYAMDYLGVSTTSLFLNLLPIVTVIASYFILDERINVYQIIGGVLVIFAVYFANTKDKKNEEKIVQEKHVKVVS
ncbi:DMT family transporter [Wukongibacter sp. M2B1]|uniref:DMT family transporter n=1 Tax=Wukongibacter sp. M2B1 TaxID=3088895 RepID=UPI003D7AFECD